MDASALQEQPVHAEEDTVRSCMDYETMGTDMNALDPSYIQARRTGRRCSLFLHFLFSVVDVVLSAVFVCLSGCFISLWSFEVRLSGVHFAFLSIFRILFWLFCFQFSILGNLVSWSCCLSPRGPAGCWLITT